MIQYIETTAAVQAQHTWQDMFQTPLNLPHNIIGCHLYIAVSNEVLTVVIKHEVNFGGVSDIHTDVA